MFVKMTLTGILVALDGGSVAFQLDNLTDQSVPADLDELVHLGARHVLCHDHYKPQTQRRVKVSSANDDAQDKALVSHLRGPATLKMRPYLDSPIEKSSTMLFLVLCVR